MAFGIGINTEAPDRGPVRGKQEDIACGCWFTSRGNMFPKFIKYEDEDGVIRSISNIEVLYSEKENFCGIPMMSYACRTVAEGREYFFTLLFHQTECRWKSVWKGTE